MSIDLQTESVFPLTEANDHWKGKPQTLQVWYRWKDKGILVDGKRVKLDAVKLGRQWYSSDEAIERLIAAQNAPASTIGTVCRTQRERQSRDACRELEKAGC